LFFCIAVSVSQSKLKAELRNEKLIIAEMKEKQAMQARNRNMGSMYRVSAAVG
jgi:hypothetical protein